MEEFIEDATGLTYTRRWETPPPYYDTPFRVLEDEWIVEKPPWYAPWRKERFIRVIKKVELI